MYALGLSAIYKLNNHLMLNVRYQSIVKQEFWELSQSWTIKNPMKSSLSKDCFSFSSHFKIKFENSWFVVANIDKIDPIFSFVYNGV